MKKIFAAIVTFIVGVFTRSGTATLATPVQVAMDLNAVAEKWDRDERRRNRQRRSKRTLRRTTGGWSGAVAVR